MIELFERFAEFLEHSAVNIAFVISLLTFLVTAFANLWRYRTLRAKQAKAKEQVEEVRKGFEASLEELSKTSVGSVQTTFLSWTESLLGQLVSTSTAQAPAGIVQGNAAIDGLRQQISVIEQQIRTHRNEIVEVSKIDPVLEATIKASIENLTKRIEFLEKTRLEKWDVALILLQMLGGIGVIFAIIFGTIKYLHP